MKQKKNLFNGVIALVLAQGIVKILGFVYKVYLANKEGFGDIGNAIYNSGYQIYALLLTISAIGVPNAIAKLVAEQRFSYNRYEIAKILKTSIIIFAVIGSLMTIILISCSKYIANDLLNIPEARYSIIALAPAIFNVCILSVYRGFFNGINKIDITAKSQSIEQFLKTVFTIVLVEAFFIISKANTVIMATVANFATTLATLFGLIYLYKKNNETVKVKFEKKYIKRILKVSIPISLSSILASLNRNIDSITVVRYLKKFLSESEAKIQYGILSGKVDVISSAPVSFIVAIATTIIPKIAGLRNKNDVSEITKKYLLITILLIMPCVIGLIGFSGQILQLLFGNSRGKDLLIISAISLFFISIEQIVHAVLQGIGKVFIPTISLTVGVIFKTILNIKLIGLPNLYIGGIRGTCIATMGCHIVACIISFSCMTKFLNIKLNFSKYILKPVLSSCIMLLSLYFAYFLLIGIIMENIAIILAIGVAITMYILSIFSLKIISKEDLLSIPIFDKLLKRQK